MSNARLHPMAAIALWDVGLVLLAYFGSRLAGAGDYLALVAATSVALLRTGYVMIRRRSFDGFSATMCLVFGAGLALSFVTGDEKLLLATKSVVTAVLGVVLLGSVAVGRPAAFGAAKRFGAREEQERQSWDRLYRSAPAFRRVYVVMTAVWGAVLLGESALRLPLIYLLPMDAAVPASTIMLPLSICLAIWWSAWYGKRGEQRARVGTVAAGYRWAGSSGNDQGRAR
ncbi:hypothetical protein GCM10022222_32170 [Amycolatopsis ultiminotia]|uniref:Intracellular septation protein A n=1 Tax=Amycolatopsis ultiminotia TaxID=543629 RepID=A0ABP6W8K3_9PSEU